MSDNAIRVGDLVMFVRSCCDAYRDGVTIFGVTAINRRQAPHCLCCGKELPDEGYASDAPSHPGAPLSWLRRIPPLGELDEAERKIEEPIT